ncbi:hypothetical protein [Nostoc sp. ATCC 53789]|nr:hypothetical protein [Nostoc sp. ATCC 53789]
MTKKQSEKSANIQTTQPTGENAETTQTQESKVSANIQKWEQPQT